MILVYYASIICDVKVYLTTRCANRSLIRSILTASTLLRSRGTFWRYKLRRSSRLKKSTGDEEAFIYVFGLPSAEGS